MDLQQREYVLRIYRYPRRRLRLRLACSGALFDPDTAGFQARWRKDLATMQANDGAADERMVHGLTVPVEYERWSLTLQAGSVQVTGQYSHFGLRRSYNGTGTYRTVRRSLALRPDLFRQVL